MSKLRTILVGLLLGKAAVASERGVELRVGSETSLPEDVPYVRELVTIVGNLVDNAFDSVASLGTGWIDVTIRSDEKGVFMRVHDSGPCVDPRSWTRYSATASRRRSPPAPAPYPRSGTRPASELITSTSGCSRAARARASAVPPSSRIRVNAVAPSPGLMSKGSCRKNLRQQAHPLPR